MKRIKVISLIMVFVMVFGCLVFATETNSTKPTLNIEIPTNMPKKGDTFDVVISLKNNPGFCSLDLYIGYNNKEMKCTDVEEGSLISSMLCASNPTASKGAKTAAASANPKKGDGIVETLKFQATSDVTDFGINIIECLITDSNLDAMDIEVVISGGKSTDPTPVDPTPVDPTPVDPTPVDPTPVDPTPEDPTPIDPTPVDPTPIDPTPEDEPEDEPVKYVFDDTKGTWCEEYVSKAVEYKIFEGYDNGKFGANDSITRAQFVTVLYRMSGSPAVASTSPFTDINKQDEEFKKAIIWAYNKGLVDGESETKFNPNGYLTREQAVKILFAYSGGQSGMELMFTSIYDSTFTDMKNVSSWAKAGMYWSIYNKIIEGTSSTTLDPKGRITRGAVAKILVVYKENN